MQRVKLFDGVEEPMEVYNRIAIIDKAIEFFTEECDEETDFTFPSYLSSYFRVFNERLGREIKDITLTQSGASLIINASALDMTFDDVGLYFYEIGYVQSGGYEVPLRYGKLRVI
jgi:hypothetical protein